MKLAAAMKYGGELVAAEDCNYDSFKELVPLCPNCKEPVFLRVGGDRLSVKGKEYKVGPHWCHFKGVSEEQVASCESRVNGYTEKDRQRIAAKARGQRLKLLQRWFWRVVVEQAPDCWESCFEQLTHRLKHPAPLHIRVRLFDESGMSQIAATIRNHVETLSPDQIWEIAKSSGPGAIGFWAQEEIDGSYVCERMDTATNMLNQKIMVEVLAFLSTKSSSHILYNLCAATVLSLDAHASIMEYERAERDQLSSEYLEGLYFWLFSIPWVSEFRRLEAESKQQRIAVGANHAQP